MAETKTISSETRNKKREDGETSSGKKDSTSAVPMVDLEEALKLVTTIQDKGLDLASMDQVAKGCGYSNPTSTPFYRRLQAARLFKLLGAPQAEPTALALDYLKPDREDAKQMALTKALTAIPAYAELVQRHVGKKINQELVSHGFARSLSLADSCASICARAFVSSLKFAGFISLDGTVALPAQSGEEMPPPPPKLPARNGEEDGGDQNDDETNDAVQTQTLYLDSKRKRKITIKAPLSVSKDELERIRAWLGFQLIVEEPSSPPATPE